MHTRNKLREAKYFLDILPEMQEDADKFDYNLSAFLNAWRSVLDIMLYDFAENYALGFSRDVEMNHKEFHAVASALTNHEAVRFIRWWRKKQGELNNSPLWEKRIINFHRGPLTMVQTYDIYVSGSGGTSGTLSPHVQSETLPVGSSLGSLVPQGTAPFTQERPEYRFSDFSDVSVIDMCRTACAELEKIVVEAETSFNVRL